MNKRKRIIPGFGANLGFTIIYISILLIIPLALVFINASKLGLEGFIETVTDERVLSSFKVSFGAAFVASLINGVFGLIISWVLVRYEFPFKKIFDTFIDLPFALPTAVAGITLTTLYSESGVLGGVLNVFGIKVSYTFLGIVIALSFIGLPFVVRTIQPVLQNLDRGIEEAANSLGANYAQTFIKVILPEIIPSILTGMALAFARAVGEYGSVVFIAGNMPMKTEIAPLLIMTKLEQFDYAGATAISAVMLVLAFIILLVINLLQGLSSNKKRRKIA
ncbi:MAG: sulfate ABC transporter permease subunit CysT [Clostridium sp.]